ncbi:hypothetical protein F4679DRAFT_120226 [Xylaria curta]|nr:hypothetical protein F4679DRAFT_120226 [Xylaria curta]
MPVTIRDILQYEASEVAFVVPTRGNDHVDEKRHGTLPGESRGLQIRDSFPESNDICDQNMNIGIPREAPTAVLEDNFKCHLHKTLLKRVGAALKSTGLGYIHGEVQSRLRQDNGRDTRPDILVYSRAPSADDDFNENIIAFGEVKLKHADDLEGFRILDETKCYEAWLLQSAQMCFDAGVKFGFVITNVELVVFKVQKDSPASSPGAAYKSFKLASGEAAEALFGLLMMARDEAPQ